MFFWENSSATIGNILRLTVIDRFTNIFKFYAYLFNKGCSWQPEACRRFTQHSNNWCMQTGIQVYNVFFSCRLMEYLVYRSQGRNIYNWNKLINRSIAVLEYLCFAVLWFSLLFFSFNIYVVPCPSGYEEGPNDHCYWFSYSYSYGNMWHWGRQDCMAQPDSDLVIIDDEEELAFLQNRITEINETKDWWIGRNVGYFMNFEVL